MSWLTSLLGGFVSGYGSQALGSKIAGQGLQSTWGQVGQFLGGLSSRGGGSSHPPSSPVQTSWDTPSQPPRRPYQGIPTLRRQRQRSQPQFSITNFLPQISQGGE